MKTLMLVLTMFSTLLVGCDRQTLDGLRLNFQGEFKSDYENKAEKPQQQSQTTLSQQKPDTSQKADQEVQSTQTVTATSQSATNSDPDAGIPFSVLENCSQGGMVAQTNKLFYQRYPELKSIDSKDQKLMKEWKTVYTEVKQQCDSQR